MFDEAIKRRLQAGIQHSVDPETSDSAVLIGLTAGVDGKIILTQRAGHMNSHAGEVAFPGGRREPGDQSLLNTALRETEEEIGLPTTAVDVVCPLPQVVTRHGVTVTPFFGLVPEQPSLTANPQELDAVFCVPVAWLTDASNLTIDVFDDAKRTYQVPSFIYQEFRIWGITAMMLFDFLNLAFAADLKLPHEV
ncbi:MAG: NUDIX hydrolase [Pseudomonadales bacterium]